MSECSRLSNSAWSVGTGQCPSVFFIHHSSFLIHHFPSPSPWPGTGSGRRQWASRRPPEASERRLEAPPPRAPAARAEGDTLADKRGQGLLHRLGVGPFERDHFNGLIRRPKRSLVEPFDQLFVFLAQGLRGGNDQGVGPGV